MTQNARRSDGTVSGRDHKAHCRGLPTIERTCSTLPLAPEPLTDYQPNAAASQDFLELKCGNQCKSFCGNDLAAPPGQTVHLSA
jgi:hypothetical protein